jgi:hypothetical protein
VAQETSHLARLMATARKLGSFTRALDVSIVDGSGNQITSFGGGSGGTSATDQSAFTPGSGFGTPAEGLYEASPTTIADGQVGVVGLTTNRELKVAVTSGGGSGIKPATATLSNPSASATSATVLAANANREGAIFVNDADKICYLKFGATASATSYSRKLMPGESYELPRAAYTGKVDGIWETGPTGKLYVTELSA